MAAKKKASKKPSTSTAEARQSTVQGLLKGLGGSVYSDLDEGRFPSLTLASRSVRNIVYDKKLQQFVLGPTTVRKSSGNIKHIRPFTQLVWLAYFAKKLVDEKRTSTLRDVFYSAQAFNVEFQDQAESDELITDLEVLMGMAREGMNIYPEERSAIFGNMIIEYTVPGYEGKRADLSANPDGVMIGPALTTAEFRDTDAEMVLAIEKGGLFTRFTEERVYEKHKALLINTAGQPPRSTRYLIRRLNQELRLPVGILCDADPWGAHIAMVIKSGSVQREEPIVIRDTTRRVFPLPIGEFVDECIERYGCYYDSSGNEICGAIPFEVLTVDSENKIKFKSLSAAIRHRNTGSLYRIESSSGRNVEVTPNHSVYILRGEQIVSLPTIDLRPGDLLVQTTMLRNLVESDITFDPIVTIEQTGSNDKHVYDVSVPGVERFIGGNSGMLLHNSANAAHLRELTTPNAVWLGVTSTDIQTYKLPSDKLTEVDIKRLYELKADPRYTEKMWHDELESFLKYKRKSEQEAFARYGLSYIVDKYLPEKLELMKSS